jgi:hypothetical protein
MDTALIIAIVSCGFFSVGIILWQKATYLLKNGKKAGAVIFKNNFRADDSGGIYYPVVRFLTDKQEWITQQLSIGYFPAKREGKRLQVIYDPEDPTNVEINSLLQLRILPGLFVVLGICGLIFGALEYLDIITLIDK